MFKIRKNASLVTIAMTTRAEGERKSAEAHKQRIQAYGADAYWHSRVADRISSHAFDLQLVADAIEAQLDERQVAMIERAGHADGYNGDRPTVNGGIYGNAYVQGAKDRQTADAEAETD